MNFIFQANRFLYIFGNKVFSGQFLPSFGLWLFLSNGKDIDEIDVSGIST